MYIIYNQHISVTFTQELSELQEIHLNTLSKKYSTAQYTFQCFKCPTLTGESSNCHFRNEGALVINPENIRVNPDEN